MLRVPAPAVKLLGYCTLMVDLCKLTPTFLRIISGCVRECFARCGTMNPDLKVSAHWNVFR